MASNRTSVPRRPFPYEPDESFDFGFAGEHPVQFLAWIDDSLTPTQVDILRVTVRPTYAHSHTEWDVTPAVKSCREREIRYQDEIREAFENAKRKDYEEGA